MNRTALSHQSRRALSWGGYAGLAVAVLILPFEAKAQDWKFSLGAGVGAAPDYEGSEDSPVVGDVGDENQLFGGVALTYAF